MNTAREVFIELISATTARRGEVPSPVEAILPAYDPEEASEDFAEAAYGYAEGQTFIIDYIDSKQQNSRRRITVWKVVAGAGGIPLLKARCHERKSNRDFRVDRIQAIIDLNGEVFEDVPSYLHDSLGISKAFLDRTVQDGQENVQNWRRMLETARPYAVLFAAISLADGAKLAPEITVAAEYCADHCERRGLRTSFATIQGFNRYLTGLRPSLERSLRSIDEILNDSPDEIFRFLKACVCVVEADGNVHKSEADMLDRISRDLTGLSL